MSELVTMIEVKRKGRERENERDAVNMLSREPNVSSISSSNIGINTSLQSHGECASVYVCFYVCL